MTQLAIGKPTPLGAHYDGQGVNFTLFSAHAERVELCVFDANGREHRYDLRGTVATFGTVICRMRAGFALWLSRSWPRQPAEGIALTRRSC